jgi:hypothetical protein
MSLKSGLQSISGSAGRAAARRVNRGSTPDRCVLNEDDDGSSSSEAEGSSEGSQDSDNQDAGLVLTAGLDDGYDDEQDEFTPGPIRGGTVDYDGTAYSSIATVVSPSATKSAKTPATAVKTRPRESKYDASKAAATKVSSKLDFSDETLQRLVKALKPAEKKRLSRGLLPKLNYSKQIMVNQLNFASWVEQIKVYTYSRRWPAWCTSVGGSITWDGVDDDGDESVARREAYEWMETCIPDGTKYILIFIRKGDAKGIYEAVWRRFASLTVKELQQKFWSLEMKPEQQVAQFAHTVNTAAVNLKHAGQEVSDHQQASAYVQGLHKGYSLIKEKYRNSTTYTFTEVVEDATNFALANKMMNVSSPAPSGSKTAGSVLTTDGTMCKYWRMKKGCFKKENCPLARYHTPETAGKGWNAVAAVVPVVVQAFVPKHGAKKEERKCYSCNKVGHLRQNCPLKNAQSKDKARANQRNNADAIHNLSLNFMMMSPVAASLFASFDLKSHWILDSGATEHISSSAKLVTQGTLATLSVPAQLTVGNGQVLQASQCGTVHFNDVSLSGVLVCEQCPVNIISEGKLLEKGLTIIKSAQQGCLIMQGKNVIMTARIQNKLMFVDKAVLSSDLIDIRRIR